MPASGVKAPTSTEDDQEMQFKSKYPGLARQGVGSLLLQKRLNKGHKFFDSGDYNMARAKISQKKTSAEPLQPQTEEVILHESTGEVIATPDSVPAVRKKSILLESTPESLRTPRGSLVLSSITSTSEQILQVPQVLPH